jgi:hypothetical protein
VITPTVSLALDHQRTLARLPGLQGSRTLTGGRSVGERDELLAAFRRGEVPVLFLSPEFALGAAREALVEAAKPPDQKYAGLDARLQALSLIDDQEAPHPASGNQATRSGAKRMFAPSELPSASLPIRDILFQRHADGRNGAQCGPLGPFIRTTGTGRQAYFEPFSGSLANFSLTQPNHAHFWYGRRKLVKSMR